jgi:hypothetical protein
VTSDDWVAQAATFDDEPDHGLIGRLRDDVTVRRLDVRRSGAALDDERYLLFSRRYRSPAAVAAVPPLPEAEQPERDEQQR